MPLELSRIRALCFDVDGTLSDTDDAYVSRLAVVFRGLPFLHEPERAARRLVMWLESPGTFLVGIAGRLSIDDELKGLVNWSYRNFRRQAKTLPSVPGIASMLRELRRFYPMAVVSARDERSTLKFLEEANLRSNFQVIVTAHSASRTKPYPDPVRLAARLLGVAPESCLMIGDTTVDIRAGRAAGAQTVGVLCGFGEQAELLRHGADLILSSTSDLRHVLLGT
jgi:HAD superfamily hydrolase (TIGR01509 family)